MLPPKLPRIAVEAGVTDGWWKYGCAAVVGLDRYGEIAPAPALFKHFGFTPENVADTVRQVLAALNRSSIVHVFTSTGDRIMTIKVGINGFGRIGRMVFRAAVQNFPDIEIVGINDLLEPDYLAYMLQYDSVHGRFKGDVAVDGNTLVVNGKQIRLTAGEGPGRAEVGRGRRRHRDRIHRPVPDQGNRRRSTSPPAPRRSSCRAPSQGRHADVRLRRQRQDLRRPGHHLATPRCTTNCLAPVAKVLNDNFGIKRGLMTTVHATTATQKTVDGPSQQGLARRPRHPGEHHPVARTGAAKAVGKVIPELNKKLTGMAFRVPTSDVSVVDLTVELVKEASYDDICAAMKAAAEGALKGVLGYTEDKVVSTDFRGESLHLGLRRRRRHRAGQHLRQGRRLVRQRVGLLEQGARDGARDREVI